MRCYIDQHLEFTDLCIVILRTRAQVKVTISRCVHSHSDILQYYITSPQDFDGHGPVKFYHIFGGGVCVF